MPLRVLLTGANGFIAQHVLSTFLEAGHSVRAVVRSQDKIAQLQKTFSRHANTPALDFFIVPDMTIPTAFDAALVSPDAPFDTVLHTASPFNYQVNTTNAAFLEPAIKGTTRILEAVARLSPPTVRRVVFTSSMASMLNLAGPLVTNPRKIYTERDWNPISWETATTTDQMTIVYLASKTFAERAAWDFVGGDGLGKKGDKGLPFDLVVLNPPPVFGPVFDPSQCRTPADLGETVSRVYNATLHPRLNTRSEIPPGAPTHIAVDVRDLAKAHLLAATVPEAEGHRFVIASAQTGGIIPQRMANLVRAELASLKEKALEKGDDEKAKHLEYLLRERVPIGEPEKDKVPEGKFDCSTELAEKVLGLTFRTPERTIGDMVEQLVEIDRRGAEQGWWKGD